MSDSNWLTDWRKNRIIRFPNRAYVDVSFSFYSRWPEEKNIYIKKEYSSWSAWSTYKYRRSQPGTVATKKKKKQQNIEKTVWREKRKAARNNLQDFFTFFSISSPITLDNQDVYFDNLSTIASFVPLYDLYLTLLFTITILIENFSVLAFLRYDQSNGRVLWQMSRIVY